MNNKPSLTTIGVATAEKWRLENRPKIKARRHAYLPPGLLSPLQNQARSAEYSFEGGAIAVDVTDHDEAVGHREAWDRRGCLGPAEQRGGQREQAAPPPAAHFGPRELWLAAPSGDPRRGSELWKASRGWARGRA